MYQQSNMRILYINKNGKKKSVKQKIVISTIDTTYNILSTPVPQPHCCSTLTFNSFYANSKLLAMLNLLSVKSRNNNYDIETGNVNLRRSHPTENTYTNPVKKIKHFPPANKEWVNSTYVYNNTIKDFPILDKILSKLIRSYFNLYNNKLRTKIRKHGSRRFEIRKSRRLMNRIFMGKPELKHSNDSVVITIYLYNLEKKYLFNKINKTPAIYKISTLDKFNELNDQNKTAVSKINSEKSIYLKKTNKAGVSIKSKLDSHGKAFFILRKPRTNNKSISNIASYKKHYMKSYINKFLRKEITSNFYKQMLIFNKQKFEKRYVTHLAKNVGEMYNKKIEFNFVSLKHIYLDSQIFSMGLVTKLKRLARIKRSFLIGLKQFLIMFKVPRINTIHTYNEIFNRQMVSQNINSNNILVKTNFIDVTRGDPKQDIIDNTLNIAKLITKIDLSEFKAFSTVLQTSSLIKAFNSVKYKIINGVRLEIAGRFTKSSSAARSVFKIRNKGSIKNKDSSNKGLPTVLLKGYAKSNLQYNRVHNKVRGGSFGVKGWLSGA